MTPPKGLEGSDENGLQKRRNVEVVGRGKGGGRGGGGWSLAVPQPHVVVGKESGREQPERRADDMTAGTERQTQESLKTLLFLGQMMLQAMQQNVLADPKRPTKQRLRNSALKDHTPFPYTLD